MLDIILFFGDVRGRRPWYLNKRHLKRQTVVRGDESYADTVFWDFDILQLKVSAAIKLLGQFPNSGGT